MITNFKQFVNENLLVPLNIEGRKEKLKHINIKLLSQEMIDGDLDLDESFMDIDPKFVKLKKVNGNVLLAGGKWDEIPEWIKKVEIEGDFSCGYNRLTTLKNCPQNIGESFYCYDNLLISLEGCSENVAHVFNCSDNQLSSLEGCPKHIEGFFSCDYNKLTSLEGCPEFVGDNFYCNNNKIKLKLPENVKLKGMFIN